MAAGDSAAVQAAVLQAAWDPMAVLTQEAARFVATASQVMPVV